MQPELVELSAEYSHWFAEYSPGLESWGVRPLDVRLQVEDGEIDRKRHPAAEQYEVLQQQLTQHLEVKKAILSALEGIYPKLIAFDGGDRHLLPDTLDSAADLERFLDFQYVLITERSGDSGRPMAGYAFDSIINPEHGIGLLLDGLQVVAIGGEEDAW
ncbi:DUF6985 domain-containing protein [Haloferula sp.]|uniref:DUF6985 domain-containing protein n=1 Tax=Haloferula sp. TaxID=2497595 RepID=UPI00329DBE84